MTIEAAYLRAKRKVANEAYQWWSLHDVLWVTDSWLMFGASLRGY